MNPVTNTADYFINATLRALKPGKIFKSPGGALFKEFQDQQIVGEVFSYVERKDGVWWQLKEGGFVKHETGLFNPSLAKNTSQGNTYSMIDRATNGSQVLSFLDDIPLVMSRLGKLAIGAILIFIGWQMFWPLCKRYFNR